MDRKLSLIIQFAAMDKLSGTMRKIVGLGDSGAQKLAKMRAAARDLDNQLKAVRGDMAGATGNITALANRERELEAAIAGVNRQAERQKRLMTIDNRVAKMQAKGDAYKSSGQQNMIAGATMMAPFILAGQQAMMFSSGMVDIQQKAALTNVETAKMAANIMAAARAAHQLPEDMRSAVDVLAGFGMDPRRAAMLAEPIGRLGTAFKVELADGAAAAYANINNLKVPLAEVGKAFDIMAAGGLAGAFEVKDMARQFPALTARMQALGQTGVPAVADLTAALQVAMNTAGSADEAGNNIANLLAKINSPAIINAFKEKFGVDLPNVMKKFQAQGMTSMEAFATAANMATKGDTKKLGWLVQDMQAQMGLLALIQNMDKYRKIRADISKAGGTVDRAFSQRELNDASVAWQGFKGQLQASAILLGTTLLPAASRFFSMLNSGLGTVSAWAQAHPRLASGIMTLVAGFAMARIGLGVLQFAFGSILGPMATVWGWFAKFRTLGMVAAGFAKLARGFALLRTAALFMASGIARAGVIMLANPLVLAIVAIVAVIGGAAYLIYKHWAAIKGAFSSAGAWLGQKFQAIKATFMAFPALFGPIGMVAGFVSRHWGAIKGAFAAGAGYVGQGLSAIKGRFVSGMRFLVDVHVRAYKIGSAIAGRLAGGIRSGAGLVGQAWTGIKQRFTTGMTWFVNLHVQMFKIGAQIIQGLVRGIKAAPGAVWNALKAVVMTGLTNIRAFLGLKSPSRLFAGIGGFISEGLAQGIDKGGRKPLRAMDRLAAGVAAAAMATAAPAIADGKAPALQAAMSIAAPSLPAMPKLGPLGLGIQAPRLPAMPKLDPLRFAASIARPALPDLPKLGNLRVGLDIGEPRMPSLSRPVAPAGPEQAQRRQLRPMARMAPAAGPPGRGAQGAGAGAPAGAGGGDTYNITITQLPGEDGEALARRVVDIIDRRKGNDQRGAYRDGA